MGRHTAGAITNKASQRLEMQYLIKSGYFKPLGTKNYSISWTSGSSINLTVHNQPEETFLILDYTITTYQGEKFNLNYKINIEKTSSNLRKGYIMYFICPMSGERCRILYRTYGSHYFKAFKAYKNRIYYEVQMASKLQNLIERKINAESRYNKFASSKRRKQSTFKGKRTKFECKKEELYNKFIKLEEQADLFLYLWYKKSFKK